MLYSCIVYYPAQPKVCVDKIGSRPRGILCVDKIGFQIGNERKDAKTLTSLEIRFYLHKEFRAAEIGFYLHKEFRAAGIRFYLHKEFLKKNHEKAMICLNMFSALRAAVC